jgi:hypothetical protein
MKTNVIIAILLLTLSNATFGTSSKRLPFIDDDFAKALKEAKRRNVPLFVDVWPGSLSRVWLLQIEAAGL